ncbi:acyltransferase family protein [Myroides marinus]|uniref:acyltransferase family protein n=1 Tax=Myroides marinus TaxID=703342 RepID=UPI002577F769|nr:acyltransferase family protein [Myroides marinus]MDM1355963.1 acyltransferase [Myroides marinus]
MGFRYDIQGLRALAVLLVFIFHLNSSWLTGGFVGVDIFFVISGFLVSSIILYKKEKGTFGFVDFYIGRIKRIVPVFLLLLIFVGIIGSWVYLSGDIQGLRKNMFHAAIFNSNNYLAGLDNYFGASSQENPLLHTWTLSIEMQFYFLLPLFLILINKKYIVPISLFIIVTLFGYSFYNSTFLSNQSAMYFSLIARIPEFLIGTVFAVKTNEIKKLIGKKQNVVALVSLIGIIVCGVLYTEHINFPGLWVVLPCVFAGTILVTTESKVNSLFSNKVLVHIGELSYSIYLWHWAIMAFVRYYFVRVDFTWYEMLSIIVLTYILSWLSYTFVENVFRTYDNKKFFLRFGGIIGGLGIVVFGMPRLNNYLSPIPEKYSKPTFGLESHGKDFKNVDFLGDVTRTNDSILLIGDSHALVNKKVLDVIGKEKGFNFYAISNNVYPPFPGILEDDFPDVINYNIYTNLVEKVKGGIASAKVIIISTSWSNRVPSAKEAFYRFLSEMKQKKKIVVLLNDFPVLDKNPIRIEKSSIKSRGIHDYKVTYNHVSKEMKRLRENNEYFDYIDINYEDYKLTLPFENDTIMYYDSDHLNVYGSEVIAKKISDEFYLKIKSIISK